MYSMPPPVRFLGSLLAALALPALGSPALAQNLVAVALPPAAGSPSPFRFSSVPANALSVVNQALAQNPAMFAPARAPLSSAATLALGPPVPRYQLAFDPVTGNISLSEAKFVDSVCLLELAGQPYAAIMLESAADGHTTCVSSVNFGLYDDVAAFILHDLSARPQLQAKTYEPRILVCSPLNAVFVWLSSIPAGSDWICPINIPGSKGLHPRMLYPASEFVRLFTPVIQAYLADLAKHGPLYR